MTYTYTYKFECEKLPHTFEYESPFMMPTMFCAKLEQIHKLNSFATRKPKHVWYRTVFKLFKQIPNFQDFVEIDINANTIIHSYEIIHVKRIAEFIEPKNKNNYR